jgi:nucleoside-diphosphate-sugar epimerase
LLNAGANVIALTRETEIRYAHPRLLWLKADLTHEDFSLNDYKADMLVHAAAIWLLPKALPKLLDAGITRVLAFGSMSAVSKADSKSSHEREVAQKLKDAEESIFTLCRERSVSATIFRPTMIYGVGADRNIMRLASVIRRLKRFPLYGQGSGLRQPVHAQDLAKAVVSAVPNPITYGKTYELGGDTQISYRDMVTRIFEVLGLPPRFFSIPYQPQIMTALGVAYQIKNLHGEMALRMNRDLVCDIEPAQKDFSYSPRGFSLNSDML